MSVSDRVESQRQEEQRFAPSRLCGRSQCSERPGDRRKTTHDWARGRRIGRRRRRRRRRDGRLRGHGSARCEGRGASATLRVDSEPEVDRRSTRSITCEARAAAFAGVDGCTKTLYRRNGDEESIVVDLDRIGVQSVLADDVADSRRGEGAEERGVATSTDEEARDLRGQRCRALAHARDQGTRRRRPLARAEQRGSSRRCTAPPRRRRSARP